MEGEVFRRCEESEAGGNIAGKWPARRTKKGREKTRRRKKWAYLRFQIKPDHVTMVAILSACSHSGLATQERAKKDLHSNSKKPVEASDTQEYNSNLDTLDEIKTPTAQAHMYKLRQRRGTQQGTVVEISCAQTNQPKVVPSITIKILEKSRARGATQTQKFNEVVVKVIKSYDERTKSFRLDDKKVKLKDNHVKLIFEISCRNDEMAKTSISKEDIALAKRLGIKEARLCHIALLDKWNNSELIKEGKIYINLGSKQEGGEVEALKPEVENVRMTVDGESPQQVKVSREEMVEKRAKQVNVDVTLEIEKEQKIGVLIRGEQAEVYGTQRGESARVAFMAEQGNEEGEKDNAEKVQGLDDFNTPSNLSFEVNSPKYKSTMVRDSTLKTQRMGYALSF
ncbi:hypothetical protein RHSIM_Rhsim06G0095000 [Rhododendron simsii]|uniref:Uncharacterized protein n=1 Tax=Rhododendron simsii TaxID=118357 RepID=A0A834GQH2_RHOSS|nr:hypothetical protein RHSIM_Rhsim06G0095000 [Rhododendron simsii]